MKKNVIVSLADSNYFPLLNELIDSIKRFKESSEVAICILDAGLSEDQKTELSSKVDEIKSALAVLRSKRVINFQERCRTSLSSLSKPDLKQDRTSIPQFNKT